jgi:hypothetical protein
MRIIIYRSADMKRLKLRLYTRKFSFEVLPGTMIVTINYEN